MGRTKERLPRLAALQSEFGAWLKGSHNVPPPTISTGPQIIADASLIISHNEICMKHGVGVLLERLFRDDAKNLIHVRSVTQFGVESIGAAQIELNHNGKSRVEAFQAVAGALGRHSIKRILCVPFYPDDVLTAIAAKELLDVPMCLYLMDDQNISVQAIPDKLMTELIEQSAVRFAIGPAMRDAYEKKYGKKFWILPPLAPPQFINHSAVKSGSQKPGLAGVLLGNIWSAAWLNELRALLRESGISIDWFGNTAKNMLAYDDSELAADGLHVRGFLDEKELQDRLQDYSFAIIPSPVSSDSHQWLAALSLPSRVPFLMSTANIPMIAISANDNPATNFLNHFEIGVVCDYNPQNFRKAVDLICSPDTQQKCRSNAVKAASAFSAEGISDWIWKSLQVGRPFDNRFENLFRRTSEFACPWVDPPVPKDICWEFSPTYRAIYRLREAGFAPDFVIDVGCSTGLWSDLCERIFPNARYILIDPLLGKYRESSTWFFDKHPAFECVESAVSNKSGTMTFRITEDLYGSTMMEIPDEAHSYQTITVPLITLDELATKKQLTGQGFLKLDCQFAEHLALEGATTLLGSVSALIVELSFFHCAKNGKNFLEMLNWLDEKGFRYFDEAGGWRSPGNGMAIQQDVIFMKKGLYQPSGLAE